MNIFIYTFNKMSISSIIFVFKALVACGSSILLLNISKPNPSFSTSNKLSVF